MQARVPVRLQRTSKAHSGDLDRPELYQGFGISVDFIINKGRAGGIDDEARS